MSNNNIPVEEIENVNWQKFYDRKMYSTHAFKDLEHADPSLLEDMTEIEKTRFINNQVERRKRRMAGFADEIKQWEKLR